MLHDRQIRAECKHEIRSHARSLPELADVQLHVLIADDDAMFVSKGLHAGGELYGMGKIDHENAVEHADHKGESQVLRKPEQRFLYVRPDVEPGVPVDVPPDVEPGNPVGRLSDDELAERPRKRINTLRRIWACGMQYMPPDTKWGPADGGYEVYEILVSMLRQSARRLITQGIDGNRVVQVWPDKYCNYQVPTLVCGIGYNDGSKWDNVRFALDFGREKQKHKQLYNKLIKRDVTDTGRSVITNRYRSILITGNWQYVGKSDCKRWCYPTNRCTNCRGIYVAPYISTKQVYIPPDEERI